MKTRPTNVTIRNLYIFLSLTSDIDGIVLRLLQLDFVNYEFVLWDEHCYDVDVGKLELPSYEQLAIIHDHKGHTKILRANGLKLNVMA